MGVRSELVYTVTAFYDAGSTWVDLVKKENIFNKKNLNLKTMKTAGFFFKPMLIPFITSSIKRFDFKLGSKNQKSISYIYLRPYGAHPVGCIGSTTFDAIAKASIVCQLGTSFVGRVVNDLKTDVDGAGEVLPRGRRFS